MFHDCFSVLCIFGCCRLRQRANYGNSRTFPATFDCSTSCPRRKWGRTAHCIIRWCRLRMPSSDVEGQRAVGSVRACILLLRGPLWGHCFFLPSSDVERQRAVGFVRACIPLLRGSLWGHLFFKICWQHVELLLAMWRHVDVTREKHRVLRIGARDII